MSNRPDLRSDAYTQSRHDLKPAMLWDALAIDLLIVHMSTNFSQQHFELSSYCWKAFYANRKHAVKAVQRLYLFANAHSVEMLPDRSILKTHPKQVQGLASTLPPLYRQ
ncbi:hypothetical protein [Flexibacterium corallicola]|uniref:hypothetical protein n=1 Tax=Flexibacterium corallicola TaxID=3037259 RepID=UPI00286F85AD|nr:hypothetical protein [Pseudovibrio sp. M1P-2-3]